MTITAIKNLQLSRLSGGSFIFFQFNNKSKLKLCMDIFPRNESHALQNVYALRYKIPGYVGSDSNKTVVAPTDNGP